MSDSEGNKKDGRQHHTFTFACGVTVELKRVPVLTIQEFARQFKRPEPPKQTVDYGQGPVIEENRSHPDYLAKVASFNREMNARIMDFSLYKGVKCTVDPEALAQAKTEAAMFGLELAGDDKLLYIKHVLVGDDEELTALANAIAGIGQPTEAAIAEKQADFKSDVQGA